VTRYHITDRRIFDTLAGRNLRCLRTSADLTLEQLGDALGISISAAAQARERASQEPVARCPDVPLSQLIPRAFDQELAGCLRSPRQGKDEPTSHRRSNRSKWRTAESFVDEWMQSR
jgi:hypothetical protein